VIGIDPAGPANPQARLPVTAAADYAPIQAQPLPTTHAPPRSQDRDHPLPPPLSFPPECPTCERPSTYDAGSGVWVCPYCGRLASDDEPTDEGPVLTDGPDAPVATITVLSEGATHDGLQALLSAPVAANDDVRALSLDPTGRQWQPNRSAWMVKAYGIERAVMTSIGPSNAGTSVEQRRRERTLYSPGSPEPGDVLMTTSLFDQ
jgi:hypothetical protein